MRKAPIAAGMLLLGTLTAILMPRSCHRTLPSRGERIAEARARPWFHRGLVLQTEMADGAAGNADPGEEALELGGTVRDQLTGVPIAGAEVRIFAETELVDVVWSDDEGEFLFPPTDPASFDRVAARAPGYAIAIVPVAPGIGRIEILLSPAVRISGRVQAPGGMPLEGVSLVASDTTGLRWPYPQSSKVLSARDGSFRIDDAPTGRVVVVARMERHVEAEEDLGSLGPGRVVRDVVLELVEGTRVTGLVRLEGVPVEGARVEVFLDDGSSASTYSDAAGRFELDGVTAADGMIIARHLAGVGGATLSTRLGETTDVVLDLLRALRLEGIVRTPDGAPIGGAQVTYRPRPHCDGAPEVLPASASEVLRRISSRSVVSWATAETGEDGRFRVDGFVCGPVLRIAFSHPDYVPVEKTAVALPASLDVTLGAGRVLAGRVVGPTGEVASSARGILEASRTVEDRREAEVRGGRFTLRGLADGEWSLSFSSADLGSAHAVVTVPTAGEALLALPGTSFITGRIVSGTTPLPGASVGRGEDERTQVSLDFRWEGRSGTDGRFRVKVPSGPSKIVVYHPEHRGLILDVDVPTGQTRDLGDLLLVPGPGNPSVKLRAGLGIEFETAEDGATRASWIWEGSGADEAGLGKGDEIVAVDGIAFRGLDEDEAETKAEGEAYSTALVVVLPADGGESRTVPVLRIPSMDEVHIEADGAISSGAGY